MSVSTTRDGRRSRLQVVCGAALFGLLIGIASPTDCQEQPFAPIDEEMLHLTPVTRQMDYINFLPSMGALRPMHTQMELFYFDNVLLPAATWLDDDPDNTVKRHLETATDIRRSVLPQTNPRGTISLLLYGNGETPLDSDKGQAGFRSNGPSLPDASNPGSELPLSGF